MAISFIFIFTEGENSEPTWLRNFIAAVRGGVPRTIDSRLEIEVLPLQGNQGYQVDAINQRANERIAEYQHRELIEEDSPVEKWIILDHDKMEKNGTATATLKSALEELGYKVIINKPNFEFFFLLHFMSLEDAIKVKPKDYETEINNCIGDLNRRNCEMKGFTESMSVTPYSKKEHMADNCFGHLFARNSFEVRERLNALPLHPTTDRYSEMPLIIRRVEEIYAKD